MPRLEGAFSTVVMTKDARGRLPRPGRACGRCALGQLGDRYCVASESCAFDIIGAELLREVAARRDGLAGRARHRDAPGGRVGPRRAFCVFEHIYFARPDSILEGNRTQVSRRKMGEILWREAPVEADVVIAVPDSGNPAATGYSKASGIPRDDGLIKNRYVARTFIQPGQELRKHGLRMKFNPLREVVARQAAGGRGRLDRARQHHAPDRRRCCATRAPPRSTCASRRRRSATPATTASTCRRRRRWSPTGATERGDRRGAGLRLARLPVARRRLRGDPLHARDPLRRLLLGRVPARAAPSPRTASSRSRSCRS